VNRIALSKWLGLAWGSLPLAKVIIRVKIKIKMTTLSPDILVGSLWLYRVELCAHPKGPPRSWPSIEWPKIGPVYLSTLFCAQKGDFPCLMGWSDIECVFFMMPNAHITDTNLWHSCLWLQTSRNQVTMDWKWGTYVSLYYLSPVHGEVCD